MAAIPETRRTGKHLKHMTPRERQTAALIRQLPPGENREFLESMLPDRRKAIARFRKYAQRAEKQLMAWELNWMSERISILLGEGDLVPDQLEAEEAERKRAKGRLRVVRRGKVQRRVRESLERRRQG